MSRAPCVRCGAMLHTGEGRVTVSFTVAELGVAASALAVHPDGSPMARRMLCAMALLDAEQADAWYHVLGEA